MTQKGKSRKGHGGTIANQRHCSVLPELSADPYYNKNTQDALITNNESYDTQFCQTLLQILSIFDNRHDFKPGNRNKTVQLDDILTLLQDSTNGLRGSVQGYPGLQGLLNIHCRVADPNVTHTQQVCQTTINPDKDVEEYILDTIFKEDQAEKVFYPLPPPTSPPTELYNQKIIRFATKADLEKACGVGKQENVFLSHLLYKISQEASVKDTQVISPSQIRFVIDVSSVGEWVFKHPISHPNTHIQTILDEYDDFKKLEKAQTIQPFQLCANHVALNAFKVETGPDGTNQLVWQSSYLNEAKDIRLDTKQKVGVKVMAEAIAALQNNEGKFKQSKSVISKIFHMEVNSFVGGKKEELYGKHIMDFKRLMDMGKLAYVIKCHKELRENPTAGLPYMVLVTHDHMLYLLAKISQVPVILTMKNYDHSRELKIDLPLPPDYDKLMVDITEKINVFLTALEALPTEDGERLRTIQWPVLTGTIVEEFFRKTEAFIQADNEELTNQDIKGNKALKTQILTDNGNSRSYTTLPLFYSIFHLHYYYLQTAVREMSRIIYAKEGLLADLRALLGELGAGPLPKEKAKELYQRYIQVMRRSRLDYNRVKSNPLCFKNSVDHLLEYVRITTEYIGLIETKLSILVEKVANRFDNRTLTYNEVIYEYARDFVEATLNLQKYREGSDYITDIYNISQMMREIAYYNIHKEAFLYGLEQQGRGGKGLSKVYAIQYESAGISPKLKERIDTPYQLFQEDFYRISGQVKKELMTNVKLCDNSNLYPRERPPMEEPMAKRVRRGGNMGPSLSDKFALDFLTDIVQEAVERAISREEGWLDEGEGWRTEQVQADHERFVLGIMPMVPMAPVIAPVMAPSVSLPDESILATPGQQGVVGFGGGKKLQELIRGLPHKKRKGAMPSRYQFTCRLLGRLGM